jgi:hypothetical protein
MSLKFCEDFDNLINRIINVRDDKFGQHDDELKKLAYNMKKPCWLVLDLFQLKILDVLVIPFGCKRNLWTITLVELT